MSTFIKAPIRGTLSVFRLSDIAVYSPRVVQRRRISGHASSAKGSFIETPTPKSSLSVLSHTALLRSFLVATISSKPYLLGPTLSFLSWLTNSPNGTFWNADRNPLLRLILKSTFYRQFCAGESAPEVARTLREMKALGFRGTILTYGKETVFDQKTNQAHGQGLSSSTEKRDPDQCEIIAAWRKGTLETVDLLGDGDQLALK